MDRVIEGKVCIHLDTVYRIEITQTGHFTKQFLFNIYEFDSKLYTMNVSRQDFAAIIVRLDKKAMSEYTSYITKFNDTLEFFRDTLGIDMVINNGIKLRFDERSVSNLTDYFLLF